MPSPELSIVVASVQSAGSIAACIAAIRGSCEGIDAEIVVVEAGSEDETRRAVAASPGVSLISLENDTLTPRLWSEGIEASSGRVVALTTAQFRVSRGWATSVLQSFQSGVSGVGGPVTLAPSASTLASAVFFLRYSAFIDATPDGEVMDVAGDNAAYRRDRIPAESWGREAGFWELDVNRAITSAGGAIMWHRGMSAEFGSTPGLPLMASHRFEHGRLFGRSRVTRGESSIAIALKAPLVPALLMARIARRVARRREYRVRFTTSLPLLFTLATAWAAGEAAGALEGQRANRS